MNIYSKIAEIVYQYTWNAVETIVNKKTNELLRGEIKQTTWGGVWHPTGRRVYHPADIFDYKKII